MAGFDFAPMEMQVALVAAATNEILKLVAVNVNAHENAHDITAAELAASQQKAFCISHVDVGLDVAALHEAVTRVIQGDDVEVVANLRGNLMEDVLLV
ncbi:hypothetical protein RIF29_22341 [Crotalaria pallida]|uniref:Uncharacterized protein n=1 Tax=Crotalaria pallida TaxID=3830 RepID=A0AAN9F918_CROPI